PYLVGAQDAIEVDTGEPSFAVVDPTGPGVVDGKERQVFSEHLEDVGVEIDTRICAPRPPRFVEQPVDLRVGVAGGVGTRLAMDGGLHVGVRVDRGVSPVRELVVPREGTLDET